MTRSTLRFAAPRVAARGFARSRTPRIVATLLLAFSGLCAPVAAAAQSLPWIGLTGHGAQLLGEAEQGSHGPGADDHFGFALAAGDFNADGYDDLASGIPGNDCSAAVTNCGSVQVRFGWSEGALGAVVTLDPAAAGAPDPAEEHDFYGVALAVGDFNADGNDDLAVGASGNAVGGESSAGAVQVHYGLPGGQGSIQWVAEHILHQDVPGVPDNADGSEFFGRALAAGDFDGDGFDDLAIGAPGNVAGGPHVGNVVVGHGHIGGLVPFAGFEMKLGLDGLPDTPEDGEEFGIALAAGDFNGDGFDDLAIGVPEEDGVGAVLVVYGSPNSLIFANHWYFGQWDLNRTTNPSGRFGAALAAGDFDGDGYDDLAVGEPLFDGDAVLVDMGIVALVWGSPGGLTPAGHEFLWEDALYGPGNSEAGDVFGADLAAGDFDGDGVDDLAIGTPRENDIAVDSGAVTVVRGDRQRGLGPGRRLRPGDPLRTLIPDVTADGSRYGEALAAGDFDGDGFADLAIGAPFRNGGADPVDAGAAAVLYGSLFRDGFETGDTGFWSD